MLSVKNLALGGLDVNSQKAITPVKARESPYPLALNEGMLGDSYDGTGACRFVPNLVAGCEVRNRYERRCGPAIESTACGIDSGHPPGCSEAAGESGIPDRADAVRSCPGRTDPSWGHPIKLFCRLGRAAAWPRSAGRSYRRRPSPRSCIRRTRAWWAPTFVG